MQIHLAVLCACFCANFNVYSHAYEPSWESLDSRPIPSWFEDAKFGIFCHWGVYAVPSFSSEWFWYQWQGPQPSASVVAFMKQNFPPRFTYADFAPMFTADLFDPDRFANIVKSSGAKYFVLTSKHVEGYTMWPRDIQQALKKVGGMRFGLYYCLYEWFNRQYLNDKANQFTTDDYVREVVLAQLTEIVNNYKPDLIWGDGEYEAPDTYWKSMNFLAWLYNDSPVKENVVVNDRWGRGVPGHHGGYLTFKDHFDPRHLIPRKWESCIVFDYGSWGFRRPMAADDVRPVKEVISWLARTIACNGNLLLNAGPTHDGRYVPIFEERLKHIGQWLNINGKAVYKTKPWIYQNDSDVW
uniref:alpha-L-fucosidase n=1 Tax=Plectus sambesii TaxID=2011161 RepID=A0A914WTA2_9BILA